MKNVLSTHLSLLFSGLHGGYSDATKASVFEYAYFGIGMSYGYRAAALRD